MLSCETLFRNSGAELFERKLRGLTECNQRPFRRGDLRGNRRNLGGNLQRDGLDAVLVMEFTRELALWTPERMKKVIDAAIENDVAIEINNRYRIPSPVFIKAAKAAGAKFSFGTNNAEAELGRMEYAFQMIRECGLKAQDIFIPRPAGQKPIQVKKWRASAS